MSYNAGIILAGETPNIMQSIAGGLQTGQLANQIGTQNALRDLYQTQGAQIAAGDPNALAALAGIDPMASLDVEGSRLGLDQTRQQMRISEEQLQLARAAGARAAASHVQGLSAEQRAQEREMIAQGLASAIPALRSGDLDAVNQVLRTAGLEPASDINAAAMLIAQYEGALPAYEAAQGVLGVQAPAAPDFIEMNGQLVNRTAPGGPAVVPVQGMQPQQPGFRAATPEEAAAYGAAAGQIGPDGRFHPINPPSGMSVEVGPDGTTRFIQGPGAGQTGPGTGNLDFQSPDAMIRAIDGILTDPALRSSTGVFSPLQNIPGTAQYRFGTRADQLSGQAFLQAYESLRGAGQITEYESRQASRAVARLDTAQNPDDYVAALEELRALLAEASQRPPGYATGAGSITPPPSGGAPSGGLSPDALQFLNGGN